MTRCSTKLGKVVNCTSHIVELIPTLCSLSSYLENTVLRQTPYSAHTGNAASHLNPNLVLP